MSDVKCVVCGEPWDFWGAKHGDMRKWEYDLFRKGSGCPSCEGVQPEHEWHPETMEDIEFGDEDPMERINAYEDYNSKRAPKWEEPKPKVLWTCDGCGVEVVEDPNEQYYDGDQVEGNGLSYHLPPHAPGHKWYNSHPYYRGEPEATPAATFGDQKACEFCVKHCAECGTKVSDVLQFDDCYAEGASFPHPDNCDEVICVDCLEHSN
jgi:hypothetical protein